MSKFNFASQICTTEEQSERLMALGLKKETADCFLEYVGRDNYGNNVWHPSTIVNNYRMPDYSRDFPAWSLNRLLCLLPTEYIADMDFQRIMQDFIFRSQNMYDEVISCIETLIKEGYFYEEHLEE